MKKKLLLLFLPMLLLVGCNNSSGGALPAKERETVALTEYNYSKYIAVYTFSDSYGSSPMTLYHYQFVGSSLCKFNDCKITYAFARQDGSLEENYKSYRIDLTLSGCGETIEVSVGNYNNYRNTDYYILKVLSASGTVEILY